MRRLFILLCALMAAPSVIRAAVVGRAIDAGERELTAGRDSTVSQPSAESQLWLVSTRRMPHGPMNSSRRLLPEVSRYEKSGGWRQTSHDELIAARDQRLTTIVLVHGNDNDEPTAREKGLAVYQALAPRADEPFRLIIWSWPADYIPGTFRQDARVKAERAEADSYYLAHFISALDRSEPISLVGYSFGARVITGGLHLLGGGSLAGHTLDSGGDRPRAPVRAVLMAAALDDDWLLPGRRHGRAMTVVERMVVLVNPQDRVLRWYRFLAPGKGAMALGARGIASPDGLGPHRQKIEQVNVNSYVGGQHGWSSYAGSPQILEQLKREIFIGAHRRQNESVADSSSNGDGSERNTGSSHRQGG